MEVKQLPKREELPENLTWDLTKIFSSDQEFDEKYLELSEELKQSEKHKGTLDQGASQFLNAIEFVLRVYRQTEVIYVYAHLKNDQDTGNTDYQALYARASSLFSKVSEAVSWFEPEILQLSDDQIWQYFKEEPKLEVYRHYIQQIVDNRFMSYLLSRNLFLLEQVKSLMLQVIHLLF